tara:strand:- start:1274 stop:1480 length:207 start_codon:yes stop_codon:yes gene_type:complete
MKIKQEILDLLSPSGFEDRFHKNYQISKNYNDAYQLTEQEYKQYFGKIRYSSYDSFRVTKNRRNRQKV